MSFHQLITRWLAAQAVEAVKQELFSPGEKERDRDDAVAARDDGPILLNCDEQADLPRKSDRPDGTGRSSDVRTVDIGFVFAMPMEAGVIRDPLKQSHTTKGDGRIFHTGMFEGFHVALVESGVGQAKAEKATEVLLDVFAPKRLVSAGYAGGLSGRLKRFAVCFPETVVRESDGAALDLSEIVPKPIPDSDSGRFGLLTTDFVASTPAQKRSLAGKTGTELVDMETFAVADVCRRRSIPLLSVRIILDTVEEQLPKDIRRIMKSSEIGSVRLAGSVLGALFRRPSSMIDLFTLRERALDATDRLARRIANELRGR